MANAVVGGAGGLVGGGLAGGRVGAPEMPRANSAATVYAFYRPVIQLKARS